MSRAILAMSGCALLAVAGCQRPHAPTIAADAGAASPSLPAPRVIIVGGGLAGLTAALTLDEANVAYHLLEASDTLGGRVATARYGEGLEAELGMQELWDGNPLLDIAKKLHVELDSVAEAAYSSVIIDGKLHPYVQETDEAYFASFLSAAEREALKTWKKDAKTLLAEANRVGLASASVRALQDLSFRQWLARSKLPHPVSEWVRLTLECELAATVDQFSALAGLLELEIFLSDATKNHHVKRGNTRLIEAMARALRFPVTRSALVTNIRREETASGATRVHVTYLEGGEVKTIDAERVIVAVPFVRVHQIAFEPPLDDDRWSAIASLGLGQYTVVHFLVSKEARRLWTRDGASVLPILSDGPLGVIYGVQQDSPAPQPLEVFSLLVHGPAARLFHMVAREKKLAEAQDALETLMPGFKKHVRQGLVYGYHPAALPVWPPGRSPIDRLSTLIRTPDRGVSFAGDWTRGSHSDAAAKSGEEAAREIVKALTK